MNTHQIEIDNEVFEYLQKRAIPYREQPNDTLRRLLLGQGEVSPLPREEPHKPIVSTRARPRRQPKADLGVLVVKGYLKEGQTLVLVDYQGGQLPQYRAILRGARLFWEGQDYSMSDLAQELLSRAGYHSPAVRGPAHWSTEDGTTVKELWRRHLRSTG